MPRKACKVFSSNTVNSSAACSLCTAAKRRRGGNHKSQRERNHGATDGGGSPFGRNRSRDGRDKVALVATLSSLDSGSRAGLTRSPWGRYRVTVKSQHNCNKLVTKSQQGRDKVAHWLGPGRCTMLALLMLFYNTVRFFSG